MNSEQLKIWFAGFYEGEGAISNDKSNRNKLIISIAQNDRTPLDIGKNIWGGYIRQRIRKSPASDKICTGHEWKLNHNQSLKFLEDIKPFMIIPYKINQVNKCEEKLKEEWTTRFKCSFCDLDFSDLSGKSRHEKKSHIHIDKLFKCPHCINEYKSKDSMNRHIKLNHNSVASVNS